MKFLTKYLSSAPHPSAKVVDGTLILSLPQAKAPVVWRMEMGHVRSSAMEIREIEANEKTDKDKKNGSRKETIYRLILKTPRDDVETIADFTTRRAALDGLMALSRAMETAEGQIRPAHIKPASESDARPAVHSHMPQIPPKVGKWGSALLAFVILCGLIFLLASFGPGPAGIGGPQTSMRAPSASAQGSASAPASAPRAGAPMSAEDFLMRR